MYVGVPKISGALAPRPLKFRGNSTAETCLPFPQDAELCRTRSVSQTVRAKGSQEIVVLDKNVRTDGSTYITYTVYTKSKPVFTIYNFKRCSQISTLPCL